MNPALKYLYHKIVDSPNRWHPFLAVYYLTYRCDFQCPYCSNGANEPYYKLPKEELPADKVADILAHIRRSCDYIVITGGEPMKHREFAEVMESIKKLGFRDVALNTNGYEVDRYLPVIAKSVNTLIFSLDTLDQKKADTWLGLGNGVFRKIVSNIADAAECSDRKYRIIISSVVTPHNIHDLYDVYDFTQRNGFTFAACPQLEGVKAPQELQESKEYKEFYDFLISEKKRGMAVHGSPLYLRYMRDFNKFSCRPFTTLVVNPLGKIFYPCLEIGHVAGNILECCDLHAVRSKGLKFFGPQPECDARCHSACALGFSLILEYPMSALQEGYLTAKSFMHRNMKDHMKHSSLKAAMGE